MPESQNQQAKQESNSIELQNLVKSLLGNQVKLLSIEISDQGIVLRGNCDSFHTKQLVQEIVRKNSQVRIVANALVVTESTPTVIEPLQRSLLSSQSTDSEEEEQSQDARLVHEKRPLSSRSSFNSVFHPSDFSDASKIAFVHALKIALESKALLQMMHVDKSGQTNWDDFPSVREVLIKWNILPAEGTERDVVELGINVKKIIAPSSDPVKACIDYFEINEVDLIVLSVHQRDGVMRWLGNIVGERISQGSNQNTLFIPVGQTGFVSQADGSVKLDHILIPIVKKPRGESAVCFVTDLISSLNLTSGKVTLLHVGPSETMPFVQYPQVTGWTWNRVRVHGDRTEEIVKFAREEGVNLIVMTTDGPDRFLDGLRGTTSERVLRKAQCPVAVIPVPSVAE